MSIGKFQVGDIVTIQGRTEVRWRVSCIRSDGSISGVDKAWNLKVKAGTTEWIPDERFKPQEGYWTSINWVLVNRDETSMKTLGPHWKVILKIRDMEFVRKEKGYAI